MSRQDELSCLERLRSAFSNIHENNIVFDNSNGLIHEIVETCHPNTNDNNFPDFLFAKGALEHFLIGSSPETPRGGSEYKREESDNRKRNAARLEVSRQSFLSSDPIPQTYQTEVVQDVYERFSYADFLVSLKSHFVSHVQSLRKCAEHFETVVFLMEQQTARLGIWKKNAFSHFYLLSQDRNALEFLSNFAQEVRYVIYMVCDVIEIIDLGQVDKLIQCAKSGEDIRGGRQVNPHIQLYITI